MVFIILSIILLNHTLDSLRNVYGFDFCGYMRRSRGFSSRVVTKIGKRLFEVPNSEAGNEFTCYCTTGDTSLLCNVCLIVLSADLGCVVLSASLFSNNLKQAFMQEFQD